MTISNTNHKKNRKVDLLWDNDPRLKLAEAVYKSPDENWLNKVEKEFVEKSIKKRKRTQLSMLRLNIFILAIVVALLAFVATILFNLMNKQNVIFASPGQEIQGKTDYSAVYSAGTVQAFPEAVLNQIVLGIPENTPACIDVGILTNGEKSAKQVPFKITAPNEPGVYYINFFIDLEYGCEKPITKWVNNEYPIPEQAKVGIVIVGNVFNFSIYPKIWSAYSKNVPSSYNLTGDEHKRAGGYFSLKDFKFDKDLVKPSQLPEQTQKISTSQTIPLSTPVVPDKQAPIQTISQAPIKTISKESTSLLGHQGLVTSIAFNPTSNPQILATSGMDGTIRLWDVQGKASPPLQKNNSPIRDLVFTPDGQYLTSYGDDGVVRTWNLQDRTSTEIVVKNTKIVTLKFSPDGQQLATTGDDGTIVVENLQDRTKKEIILKPVNNKPVLDMAFSSDSQQLASGGADGNVLLWDLQKQIPTKFGGHVSPILSVAFSPDNKQLISGCKEGMIRSLDLNHLDKDITMLLHSHSVSFNSVAYSPNGKLIVSGDNKGNILWKSEARKGFETFPAHPNSSIKKVSISPDGKTLATIAVDGIPKLWRME